MDASVSNVFADKISHQVQSTATPELSSTFQDVHTYSTLEIRVSIPPEFEMPAELVDGSQKGRALKTQYPGGAITAFASVTRLQILEAP